MDRYLVGCAGQFMLYEDTSGCSGLHASSDDRDEAIVMCEALVGAYVIDRQTGECFGPGCFEEIEEAKERLASRVPPS